MTKLFVLFCIVLIVASIVYRLMAFDSRPLISSVWILIGILCHLLSFLLVPRFRKAGRKFFLPQSFFVVMFFIGVGFFLKAQSLKDRFSELNSFHRAQANLQSCRVGEEAPSRFRKPKGNFFPIWTYQYSAPNLEALITSHSESMSDFSVRKHFRSQAEAQAACDLWSPGTSREILFDPKAPELSLIELPVSQGSRLFIFFGSVFSFFSAVGMLLLVKKLST